MNNIYEVVSEEIYDSYLIEGAGYVPEPYCIAELVVARTRSQAGYMAWKNDKSWSAWMLDKPKMSVKLRQKDVDEPIGFVTHRPEYQDLWF